MITQIILNGFISGCLYSLVAIGFGLIYSTTRFFHFAHGAIYTIAAYLMYTAFVFGRINLPISIFIAILGAGFAGCLIELGIYRPLRRCAATPLTFLLASMGIYIVLQNGISLIFGDDMKSVRGGVVYEGIEMLGARITPVQLTSIVVTALLFTTCILFLSYTRLGKEIRAVANNPDLAQIVGINVDRVYLVTFFLGSVLAGIAAILISFDTDITPMMGFYALLMGVVAVIVGGTSSLPGALLGGMLIGITQSISSWKIGSQWQDAIVFLVLIAFLIFRPFGFFGIKIKKAGV